MYYFNDPLEMILREQGLIHRSYLEHTLEINVVNVLHRTLTDEDFFRILEYNIYLGVTTYETNLILNDEDMLDDYEITVMMNIIREIIAIVEQHRVKHHIESSILTVMFYKYQTFAVSRANVCVFKYMVVDTDGWVDNVYLQS
jgi:hypothetical protein